MNTISHWRTARVNVGSREQTTRLALRQLPTVAAIRRDGFGPIVLSKLG